MSGGRDAQVRRRYRIQVYRYIGEVGGAGGPGLSNSGRTLDLWTGLR